MSKHTSGPWFLRPVSPHLAVDIEAHPEYFAQICSDIWHGFALVVTKFQNGEIETEEAKANVALLITAPEMLTALENCVVDAEQNLTKAERLQRIEYIKTVIAKARGEI